MDLQERSITIRPNSIRGLKTKGSHRTLPLSHRAAETLQEHRKGKEDGEAIFPNYARPRGNDAASAMLMKRLTQGHYRQEAYDAFTTPPHEGQAEEYRLPGGYIHGHSRAWL